MLADRHTQTDRLTDRDTLLPYRGGVITCTAIAVIDAEYTDFVREGRPNGEAGKP